MICEFCKQEIKTDAQYIKDLWFHNDCILRAVVENQQLKEDIKGYEQERQKIYNSIPFKENQQLKEQVEYLRRSCERKEDTIIDLQFELTIIDELEKWCKSFTTEEFNYNFLVVRIKDILDKISELKGEKNE